MRYGWCALLSDLWPLVVCLSALVFGVKVIVGIVRDKPVIVVFRGSSVIVFAAAAVILVLAYVHLQVRWMWVGFESSACLETLWSLTEGSMVGLLSFVLYKISRQV